MPPWEKYKSGPMTTVGTPAGMLSAGNLDLGARPIVKNADGSISTVRSMSFNEDGREVLVPTVSPDGRIMSDDEAIDHYRKTGENLGMFSTPEEATSYAESLHNQQDKMYTQPKSGPWGRYQGGEQKKPEFAGGMAGSAALGAGDTMSFGFGDELGAGLGATSEYLASLVNGEEPRSYDQLLTAIRDQETRAKQTNPGSFLTGQIAGGLAAGAGLAGGGLSATANAVGRGASLGRVAATSAGEGALLGSLQGFGSGEGVGGRLQSAGVGAASGLALGAAIPLATAGVQQVAGMAAAPLAARAFPERYAERALGETLRRSGMSADDIEAALSAARADGQDMFTVADAMGNAGQRMLSTAARTPHNERQAVIEGLQGRQVGQGERLASYLAEGFDAPDTAAQRAASLTGRRAADAEVNYGAARTNANPVNLNGAISEIDTLLGRDPILGDTALSVGPLGPRLRSLRDQLQRGGEQLVDFDRTANIKSDMFQQMQRNPQVAGDMRGVYGQLDAALENSSDGYRLANDTYRQQSRVIDAVDAGRGAASPRVRAADSVPAFQSMLPDEQSAFRAGYVDPYISRIESSSMSPTTNKARGLITPKTGEEFPAFAAPGRGDQMGNRIAREQRMFETSNAALGGSKTADNLADAAELNKFDPGVMGALMSGRPISALMAGAKSLMNEAKGTPPRVVEQLARALMESDPAAARAVLQGGQNRITSSDQLRAQIIASMMGSATAGAGRIAAP